MPTSAEKRQGLIATDVQQITDFVHLLGYNFFEPNQKAQGTTQSAVPTLDNVFEFKGDTSGHPIHARALYQDESMVVLKDSLCSATTTASCPSSVKALRVELEKQGIIVASPDPRVKIFARDYAFTSASAASGVVAGRSSNGKAEWKKGDKTLNEWLAAN